MRRSCCKRIPLGIVMLLLFVTSAHGSALELTLLCDKSVYLTGEPIWIDILVINRGDATVSTPYCCPDLGTLGFTVVNNETDTLPYSGSTSALLYTPTYDLEPGDTLYSLFNLLDGYSRSAFPFHGRAEPLEGAVSIVGIYNGEITSNELFVTIIHPNDGEAAAYELLKKAMRMPYSEASVNQYQQILDRFPGSVYAPEACWELSGAWGIHFNDSTQCLKYTLMLLDNYPNSGWARSGVGKYVGNSKGLEREAKLDSLRTADKPFRLRMLARNLMLGVRGGC